MLDTLINLDRNLFLAINGMHSAFTDQLMFWISDRFIWIPFYIVLAVFLFRKFGKHALYMVLFAAVFITMSDQLSVLFKNYFERERPCHDESIAFLVHTVNNKCGGKFGFVSSHAANVMAVFTWLLLLTKNKFRMLTWCTAIWVILVSYSRVYMGVHFPADIAGGWIVGALSALVTYIIYRLIFESPSMYMKNE